MLIPFGLKQDKFYDVSEVVRGRACDCICPSCKQALIAKKGDPEKKVHHFAHDKKAKDDPVEKIECEYSFCVVARLVIKQSIRELESFEMLFPEWVIEFKESDKFDRENTVTGYVTQSHKLLIEKFEVEPSAPLNELDIICHISGYPVGIHFSYNGRPSPSFLPKEEEHLSLIDIDLESLKCLYDDFINQDNNSFKELVMDYVFKFGTRRWLTHVRYSSRKKDLKAKLKDMIEKSNTLPPVSAISIIEKRPKSYKASRKTTIPNKKASIILRSLDGLCVRCHKGRVGYIDDLICAPCLQHYYAIGIYHCGSIKKAIENECII